MRKSSIQTVPRGKAKFSLAKMRNCNNCEKHQRQLVILRREVSSLARKLEEQQRKNHEMGILCQEIQKTKDKLIQKMVHRNQSFCRTIGPEVLQMNRNKYPVSHNVSGFQAPRIHEMPFPHYP